MNQKTGITLVGIIFLGILFSIKSCVTAPTSADYIPFYPQKGYRQAQWDKRLFDATFEACQKSYKDSTGAKYQLSGAVAYRDKKRYTVQVNNEKLSCIEAHVFFSTNAHPDVIEFHVKMLERGNSYEPFLISNQGKTSLPSDYRSKYENKFRD